METEQIPQADPKDYARILDVLIGLFREERVYTSILPPFRVDFEIDDRPALLASLKQAGIEGKEKDFRSTLSEIERIVLAILRNEEDRFINGRLEELETETAKDEEKKTLKDKFHATRDFLMAVDANNSIGKRYNWKASSKAPSYTGVDWDIKEKLIDGKVGVLEFPYATCRIQFQRDFSGDPFLIIGGRMFDSIQLNFSREEAEHLVKIFQRIVEELKIIEKKIAKKDANL
jgi:hypothetical protein